MKRKIYLIGPTIGITKLNLPAFEALTNKLEAWGHTVVKQHDLFTDTEDRELNHMEQMARRRNEVARCTDVLLIAGWSDDWMAREEYGAARNRGLDIHTSVELGTLRPALEDAA